MISLALHHARGDDSDPQARHKLHGNPGCWIGILKVLDQLRDILNRIHVVVRWWRDQSDTRSSFPCFRNLSDDLIARQLSTLARLCSLRQFDLQLLGVCQVLCSHAEAARGHLFDLGAEGVTADNVPSGCTGLEFSLLQLSEAHRVLSTFTGVALTPDPVHGNGHGAVGLIRDGTKGRGTSAKALDDLHGRLNLRQRDGVALIRQELQLPADLSLLSNLVLPSGEHLESLSGVETGRFLHLVDDIRGIHVDLGLVDAAEVVLSEVLQLLHLIVHQGRLGPVRECHLVQLHRVHLEDVEACAV
mmetsp:Transcript_54993/g.128327  ORF Transcript_54993/g.128327 Transcript_54993/m.128327 type:complete len:302 (-) Transcript_54993:2443-3348(-)